MTSDQMISTAVIDRLAHLEQMIATLAANAAKMPVASVPKAVKQTVKTSKPTASAPALTDRHKAVLAAFKRRGIKDPKLFTDIKPFKAWMAVGRIVRKGQKSVNGLFHVSQTDPIKN
jgi:hypothetical protein